MAESKKRSDCPISSSLEVWGDKWSLLIVRDLMFAKQCTYGDFLKSGEKIATNILASRLQTLEENGIITKSDHPGSKAKVLYQLTQKGTSFVSYIGYLYRYISLIDMIYGFDICQIKCMFESIIS